MPGSCGTWQSCRNRSDAQPGCCPRVRSTVQPAPWCPPPVDIAHRGLLRRPEADCSCNRGDLGTLLLDGGGKFGRCGGARDDAERWQPIADRGFFHDCSHVSSDVLAKVRCPISPAEEPRHAVEAQIGISTFGSGRNIGRQRCACPVEYG